jgi:alanine racemase
MIQLRGPLTLPAPARLEAPNMSDTSWIEIDLRRLERNVAAVRQMLTGEPAVSAGPATPPPPFPRAVPEPARAASRGPMICGVVKKNAYGLGAVAVASRLAKAGCDMLTVYTPAEAEELFAKANIACPVLVMMPLRKLERNDPLYRPAAAEKLHLAIHDRQQLEEVNAIGQTFGIRWPVHLYLDTGMSRSGLNLDQFAAILADLGNYRHVRIAGVYSHFATADSDPDFAHTQFNLFDETLQQHASQLPQHYLRHIAATSGMLRDRRFHLDMIRPGLGLFGYGPEMLAPGPVIGDPPQLEPVVRWVSRVIHVQRYARWTPVGYGSTHRLKRDSILAVVPVGYGDGYPVALSNLASVRVHPVDESLPIIDAKVLGRVNMDQIIVDVTDLAVDDLGRVLGAAVEVISAEPDAANALPKLADMAKTHPYELLCRLSPNIPRRYLNAM